MKKGPGRPKGSKNKITTTARDLADRLGCDTLEILILFAKGDWEALGYVSSVYHMESADGETREGFVITPNMRLTAAKEATKYLYPTQKAVEVTTEGSQIKLIVEDYTRPS